MRFHRIFSKIYQRAARKMCFDCRAFIERGSRILDLGCGSGIVGKNFQDFFKAELTGVDIADSRIYPIDFKIIDGKSLPFGENSFDAVLISYVLHHAEEPSALLKEARRVARDKIIIYEDLAEGFFSGLICKIHGKSFKYFFQENRGRVKFLNTQDWKKTFEELRLKLIFEKKASSIFSPVKKQLFILEKS